MGLVRQAIAEGYITGGGSGRAPTPAPHPPPHYFKIEKIKMRMTVRFWPEGPPWPWAGQEPAPAWAFHVPFLCHEWLHDFGEVHKTTDLHELVTYFRFTLQAFRLMDTSLVCRSLKNVPRFYCFDKENLNRTCICFDKNAFTLWQPR